MKKFFVCYREKIHHLQNCEVEAASPEEAAKWIVTNHPHRTAEHILVSGPCHFANLSTELCFRNPLCETAEPKKSKRDDSKRERPKDEEKKSKSESRTNDAIQYASVLGLSGEFTTNDIKKAYRSLVTKNHPDKVASMDSEFVALADKRMKHINRAYEYFRKAHGF